VSRTTRASITFVASRRPPRPASTTATSTCCSRNSASAAAVRTSNCVAPSAPGRTRSTAVSKPASLPATWMRSLQPLTCGDVYAPTRRPSAWRSAAILRVAVDLPFVPTTWMEGYARCGSPRSRNSARIRSSPNSAGHGVSDSIHLVGESVELTAIALQLLPFCVDDARGRVLDEAIVRKHSFGAGDLFPQPLDLSRGIPVRFHTLRFYDSVEDARLF